jgi:hypothetical protein
VAQHAVAAGVLIGACSGGGLPATHLPTDTGKVVDEGSITTRKGTERFAITERKGGGFILHTKFEALDMVLELDASWHPIGGVFGTWRLELVDGKLVLRGGDHELARATGATDLYEDPMSIAQYTPVCSLQGDKLAQFPDVAIDVQRHEGHQPHDGGPRLATQTVTLTTRLQSVEVTCAGPKLLVFVGGNTVAYRNGYRDLAVVESGGIRVP